MVDIALAYDVTTMTCDMVFNGRDFALDVTPATAMLISMGSDRRAHLDDTLPDSFSGTNPTNPGSLMERRGSPTDALDAQSRLMGCRFWVFQREKQTEQVRLAFEAAAVEALDWLNTQRGLVVQISVRWVQQGVLGVLARAGATQLQLNRAMLA